MATRSAASGPQTLRSSTAFVDNAYLRDRIVLSSAWLRHVPGVFMGSPVSDFLFNNTAVVIAETSCIEGNSAAVRLAHLGVFDQCNRI